MKKILLIIACLLNLDLASAVAAKLAPAVRRTLARELAGMVVTTGLSPLQLVLQTDAQRYADDYRHKITEALVEKDQLLHNYSQLLVEGANASVDIHVLAGQVSTVVHTVGKDYASRQDGIVFKARAVQQSLVQGFQGLKEIEGEQREGEISLVKLYDRLSELPKHVEERKELQAVAEDMSEYLQYYPKLDKNITEREFTHLLDFARNEQTTPIEIEEEIDKVLAQPADALFDIMRKRVSSFDAIGTPSLSNFDDIRREMFFGNRDWQKFIENIAYSFSPQKQIDDLPISISVTSMRIDGLPFIFNITFAQLLEKRFLAGITAQFLSAMNWSWHEFSTLLYPNDSEQAALFAASHSRSLLDKESQEHVQSVLQAEKAKLPQKASTIDNFLTELPTVIAKEIFMTIFLDAEGGSTRDGEIPRLLEQAKHNYQRNLLRWGYLPAGVVVEKTSIYYAILEFMNMGVRKNVSKNQFQKKILTPQISAKLLRGEIVNEQDLNTLQMQNSEDNLKKLVAELATSNDQAQQLTKRMGTFYYSIPMLVQRDSFLKKIANGVTTNQNLLKVLENVEQDSFYRPLAVKFLHDVKGMSRKERTKNLDKLRATIRKDADVISKIGEIKALQPSGLTEEVTGQQEFPVELPDPAVLQKQKKQLRELQRKARQPNKTAAPKMTAEQRRQQAQSEAERNRKKEQREAKQKAADELIQKIVKLSLMVGKTSLPADTPVWLHLRAVINYAGIDVQSLAQRSDLKDMQARFFALVAQDAAVLPEASDLASIELALEKFIQKRNDLLPRRKSIVLDRVYDEMYKLKIILEAGG